MCVQRTISGVTEGPDESAEQFGSRRVKRFGEQRPGPDATRFVAGTGTLHDDFSAGT